MNQCKHKKEKKHGFANNFGFTMVELLVTLVLLGLIASVAAPSLDSWLRSRQANALRSALSSELALLPMQANRQGSAITISDASQLQAQDLQLEFLEPVVVLANGYCKGGQIAIIQSEKEQNDKRVKFDVLAPYCEIRRHAQD
ncbi:Prepilin-type cleavage/methylation [Paraglaciecola sp. T6c]|uniref:prepilin-type N-terminal cleavage/methylation domain-containing protein n=1 Tax=Pseudoalteromonas atlantica (strain T6c / ATCC BAA-1087) TaxID=3042615 RepID=UPI0000DA6E52|nr:prepilin-type N-terminal cleavage/methylation domain-containing protein [Paraglaciecola sp. T6c]ABG41735.1 Prepilin-type cleavage/methylation [Paraglaciecola sp. T6c]